MVGKSAAVGGEATFAEAEANGEVAPSVAVPDTKSKWSAGQTQTFRGRATRWGGQGYAEVDGFRPPLLLLFRGSKLVNKNG